MFAVRTCIQWRAVHVPFSGPNNMSAKCPNWRAIHTTSPRLQSYMVRGTPFWSGGRGRGLRTCTHAWAGGSGTRMLTRENFWNFSLFDVWKCIMDCGRFVPGIEALVKKINGAKRWFEGDGREGDYSSSPCAVTVVSESRSCVQRRKVCMAPLESAGTEWSPFTTQLPSSRTAEGAKLATWNGRGDRGVWRPNAGRRGFPSPNSPTSPPPAFLAPHAPTPSSMSRLWRAGLDTSVSNLDFLSTISAHLFFLLSGVGSLCPFSGFQHGAKSLLLVLARSLPLLIPLLPLPDHKLLCSRKLYSCPGSFIPAPSEDRQIWRPGSEERLLAEIPKWRTR